MNKYLKRFMFWMSSTGRHYSKEFTSTFSMIIQGIALLFIGLLLLLGLSVTIIFSLLFNLLISWFTPTLEE